MNLPESIRKGTFKLLMTFGRKKYKIEVTTSQNTFNKIQSLVDNGAYRNRSDFLHDAICEKLAENKIESILEEKILDLIKTNQRIRDEIKKISESVIDDQSESNMI